jgi:metallophosphoesterase superfamily enzyme
VSLGDSLYDASAPGIQADDLDILKIMQEDRRWVWVGGGRNRLIPTSFGGQELRELMLEGITLRRSPWPTHATHEIAGGMLPAARVSIHGTALRRLCFVGNGLRLVLPAFGASRGGLNILDDAFNRILGSKGLAVWMLADEGLYPIAGRLLRED